MSIFDEIIITDISRVFMVPSPKGRYTEMKNRETYGLSFCKSGQTIIAGVMPAAVWSWTKSWKMPQKGNFWRRPV